MANIGPGLGAAVGNAAGNVMAAALAAGMLAELHTYLTVCRITTQAQRDALIQGQGFTAVYDLMALSAEDAKGLVRNHNDSQASNAVGRALKLGFVQEKNLKTLIWWLRDKNRRNLVPDVADWTEDEMRRAHEMMDIEATAIVADKSDKSEIPALLEKDIGVGYYDWDKKVENALAMKVGVTGLPLDYVIRRDKDPGWDPAFNAANEHEKLIYQVSLTGPAFQQDTRKVFNCLKQVLLGTPPWEWVRHLEHTQDGRLAMAALRIHYEGQDAVDRRVGIAEGIISMGANGVFFRDEYTYSFEKYATNLRQAYLTLQQCRQPMAEETMVRRLHDGIQVQGGNQTISFAKNTMLENHRHSFNDAVTYMSTKVTQVFPPRAGNKRGAKRGWDNQGDYRRISEATRGGGRFGRGNGGRGRGDGGRGGRGYDGGRNSWNGGGRGGGRGGWHGRGRGGGTTFNGVDCSDVTVGFSPSDWDRMGADGRYYVNKTRGENNRNRNTGGRSHDGRWGRGGAGRAPGDRQVSEVDSNTEKNPESGTDLVVYDPNKGGQAGKGMGRGAYYKK